MKIRIKESQYTKLNEAVGVPTNIVEVAQQLYNKIISSLDPNDDINSFIKKKITLKDNFQINDYKFKTIKVSFSVDDINDYSNPDGELPRILLQSMTHHGKVKMNAKFNFETNQNMNKVELSITFAIAKDVTTQEVIDEFKKERTLMVSSLAHELKHSYDEYVDPIVKTHKRVDYKIGSQRRFGNIPPLNELLSYMYFAHTTENLVRATELYAALEESGITKKDFYKFITNHKVYENYKKGANLSYEKLREDLKLIIPQIKQTFDDNDIDYPENISDDDMVDLTLLQFFKTLLQWKAGNMKEFLVDNFMEELFGFKGAKERYYDKYLSKITRFGGDYERFFRYEINQTRNICFKMMKKISKIYSLIKDKNPQD
jgi:hypothetical protein